MHAPRVRTAIFALILVLTLSPVAARAATSRVEGRWAGSMSFRGDSTPVGLEIRGAADGPGALLDLPELVMHREPVAATRTEGGVTVELPLGIGAIPLSLEEGALLGSRTLGEDSLTLELRPDRVPPPAAEEIEIRRGGAVLRGTLVRPAAEGPRPAVVLVHGSAAFSRESWGYRSWAWALARQGVAALATDRRGSGASTSETEGIPGFDVLAGDALAWVDHLRSLPGIRSGAIGLMGGSQAGWVAPLAASRSAAVAFLILKACPGVTPAQQEIRSAVGRARARGLDGEAVSELRSYLRLYFYVAATGRGWDLLQEEIRRAAAAPWGDLVDQPLIPENLAWWRSHANFSPADVLPGVSVPVLAAYGTRDLIVPPEANAPLLEHLLRAGGNDRVRVMVLEDADHRLERPMGRDAEGRWRWPRVAPEFLQAVGAWIREAAGPPAPDRP